MDLPEAGLAPQTRDYYCRSITALQDAGVEFLVGGAYALACYTGIVRHTKDFDIFVRPADRDRVLGVLAAQGCRTEVSFPHWLAKAYCGEDFVDVIYSAGNGVAVVDDDWFAHAVDGEVFGRAVRLCPAEEIIWSKAFIMERERFDGADIAHLLHGAAARLDWGRVLARFGENWRVLGAHLTLFGFVYPGEQARIPAWVVEELAGRLLAEAAHPPADEGLCRGTLVSREQYLIDVRDWGYRDARLEAGVRMDEADIAHWTRAIADK